MFIHNQIIDSVQSGKKQFVNTFVQDAKFKEELNKLIDAQALAAKASVDASLAIAQAFVKNTTEAMKKVAPSK
jgi:dTDP-D-glucose 4,6-dehydratase